VGAVQRRYYRFALLFLLFDVEVVFLFPWATQAGALGWGALSAIFFFFGVMVVGFVYEWKRGGMEWDESVSSPAPSGIEPAMAEPEAA
jgi:NADH-quinone oxidoreductase subunit A